MKTIKDDILLVTDEGMDLKDFPKLTSIDSEDIELSNREFEASIEGLNEILEKANVKPFDFFYGLYNLKLGYAIPMNILHKSLESVAKETYALDDLIFLTKVIGDLYMSHHNLPEVDMIDEIVSNLIELIEKQNYQCLKH